MKTRSAFPFVIIFLFIISSAVTTSSTNTIHTPITPALPVYSGSGTPLDVYEFCQNQSDLILDAKNNTAFSYNADWYPTPYRGYLVHADIMNVRATANPVPNGDFEQYPEVGNNWTLADSGGGLVNSVSNTSGGNPGSCLDIELAYSKLPNERHALIQNNFTYSSAISPDAVSLFFDIHVSPDITIENWLIIEVSVETSFGSTLANWVTTTLDHHSTTWEPIQVASFAANGSLTLKIDIIKSIGSNLDVDGHIYFDNFRYEIGSFKAPSEVGLSLNDVAVNDTFGSYGEVNIYADPILKEEINLSNAWTTTQIFTFNSTDSITFDFEYTMAMKSESSLKAQAAFTVEPNTEPRWAVNYTIPSNSPPANFTNYQFGLYLWSGWQLHRVLDNSSLTVFDYHYKENTRFFLLDEGIGSSNSTFTILAQSTNYITEVYFQRSHSAIGPWENMSTNDYFVTREYLRVIGILNPISSTGNTGVVSITFSNGTEWVSDSDPTFNSVTNTLTSEIWQIPETCEELAGSDCTAIVTFASGSQCGLSAQELTTMSQAQIDVFPINNSELGWVEFDIIVNVQDFYSEELINDALVRLRYFNLQGQIQSVEMSDDMPGVYSTTFSPGAFESNSPVTFYIEFYKAGYVNSTFEQGTATQFTIVVNTGLPPEIHIITIGIVLAIIIFISWLLYSKVYKQRYVQPKQQQREKKLQEVLSIYNDVTNLSRFLVLHRGSGIALFDALGERSRDGSLIGGFLQAIQAFSSDVNGEQQPQNVAQLSEISYEGFRIIINDGRLVRTAIVYRGTPSETLREKLETFTQRFEERHEHDLIEHGHDLQRFQNTTNLLEEIFHISLLFPHKVEPIASDIDLSNLESRLHFVALELTKEQSHIYLSEVMSTYMATVHDDPVELLNSIFQLRDKGLLVPLEAFPSMNSSNNV